MGVDKVWDDEHREIIKKLSDYDSDYDTISRDLDKKISDMADSDYYETDIGKLALRDGQKSITWNKFLPDEYNIRRYKDAKDHMRSQISKLKKKVQLYGNLQKHNIYNQKRGMLNKRQLHKIPMGMTDLFKATVINEDKPLDVCLLVDESGSMGSYTMAHARNGAIAIKEALSGNDKINLWVYGHSADETSRGTTEMIEYYSPTMKDRPMAMGGMKARYENRDGNAIIASAQRIKGESDNQSHKLMIVLSDGAPSADGYRGHDAIDHTKKAVKYAETQGWSIIQVGFSGATSWTMEKMFDNWVYVEDDNKLGDVVSKIIRKVIKI
jgi:nitric oxide reductase activation protein